MSDRRVFNICFHGVGAPERTLEPGEGRYWIAVDLFHRVLDALSGRTDVAISFDDGNRSDLAYGLRALVERDQTATFFVLAGRLGQGGSLDSTDLRELRAHGMTIGSHGMFHVPWRGLKEAGQQEEWVRAREVLAEAAGCPITTAALPLGQYDRGVLRDLRDLRYERVYTSDRLPAKRHNWFQPRYSVRVDDTLNSIRRIFDGPTTRQAVVTQAKIGVKRLR